MPILSNVLIIQSHEQTPVLFIWILTYYVSLMVTVIKSFIVEYITSFLNKNTLASSFSKQVRFNGRILLLCQKLLACKFARLSSRSMAPHAGHMSSHMNRSADFLLVSSGCSSLSCRRSLSSPRWTPPTQREQERRRERREDKVCEKD